MKSLTSEAARLTEIYKLLWELSQVYLLFGLYGLGYLDQNNWKRDIILITREPNEPNQPSISEQCNLAINAKSHL